LMLAQITPVILSYNEAANIERVLEKLAWARDVVVVDSHSTDSTPFLVRSTATTRLFPRPFDTHAMQWTFAVAETGITTEWVLALDADYVLTDGLIAEMASLNPEAAVNGYSVSFEYWVAGKPLRGSLYPRRIVLFRRRKAHYVQHGHTQRVVVEGMVKQLTGKIKHDDRKSLAHWLSSQRRYVGLEAAHLLSASPTSLGRAERIRRLGWPAPILVFLYTLFWKGCLLDGWRGWFYVLQRTIVEAMIAVEIIDRKLTGGERQSRRQRSGAAGNSAGRVDAPGSMPPKQTGGSSVS
jgi:glycosyltransferase involved in cell wall biosynthesis